LIDVPSPHSVGCDPIVAVQGSTAVTSPSTPHIDPKGAPIADVVLMPGDPLRAKFIAETYLEDAVCFNQVRNMLGFSGTYRGREVSVMGSGMGIPSISLYSHELIHTFGVKTLVRVGSCGGMQEGVGLYDIVIGQSASTDSNYLSQFGVPGTYAPTGSYRLIERAVAAARDGGHRVHVGNVLSSDIFYNADESALQRWMRMGVLAVEMESAGLYANAAAAGVEALGVFTVSDDLVTGTHTTPEERQTAFTAMMEVALATVTA